jgi:two-component system phosphate regulon sensor histidine kinase PhoR
VAVAIECGQVTGGRSGRLRRALPFLVVVLVFAGLFAAGEIGAEAALVGATALSFVVWLIGGMPDAAAPPDAASTLAGADDMRALLEAIGNPALLLDRQSTVVGANAPARAALPALRIGEPLSFALRVPEILDSVKSVAGGAPPRSVDYMDRVPVERWTEAQIGAVSPSRGGPLVLVQLRDLTPMRRAERMRVDFVANASHELRTPLASLLGFVETLQGPAKNDPAARERFLEIMRTQANRMARLIDDLLSLSRIEQRVHLPPVTPVDLAPIVRQVADALAPLAADRSVEIALDMPDRPLLVLGDRDELIRVAENLVENAIKYGGSGGRVEVTLADRAPESGRPAEVVLTVRDHGPGIPAEHLPRLTERFYRVDVADSRDKGGTGLGLALVKHVVLRHRGRLDIASTPGEGALFTVTIPRAAPEETAGGRHPIVMQPS